LREACLNLQMLLNAQTNLSLKEAKEIKIKFLVGYCFHYVLLISNTKPAVNPMKTSLPMQPRRLFLPHLLKCEVLFYLQHYIFE